MPDRSLRFPFRLASGKQLRAIFSLAALLSTLIGRALPAQAAPLKYLADPTFSALSRKGTPKDISQGGGKRGICMTNANSRPLSAIVPPADFGGLSATVSPTFWVYLPYASDTPISGVLSIRTTDNWQAEPFQKVPVTLPSQPGLVKFKLPVAIDSNQLFAWTLTVVCDAEHPSRNPFVGGMVLAKPNPELLQRIAGLTPPERVAEFARSGYWYDALDLLAGIDGEAGARQLMQSSQ
jgi:hypothetical protein